MIGLDSYSRQVFIYLDPILIYISLWIDCLFEIRKIAVCFLWLSLPGDCRVTEEALTQSRLITLLPSLIARRWVGRQTQWWPRHKAIYLSWFGPELFCLLLGPPGFNCWFSSAPVFQWCCSTPQGSPVVGRNTFLSSPHLCFIIVFICDLFVSRDDPLMS